MRYSVGVMGGTGIVGQRMVSLLSSHPWFDLEFITASEKSRGKRYSDAVNWIIEDPLPQEIAEFKIIDTSVEEISKYKPDIVFSALPSNIAAGIELELAKRGIAVISNASPMRMENDVPLINPEVNADHIELIEHQKEVRKWNGFIVKVPNCSTAILTLALKPLHDEFGLEKVIVSTMQSLSGAGLKGVPSMMILDNIIPYISKEEWKIENETKKILGTLNNREIKYSNIKVSASCHRVMVLEGHLETVFIETEKDIDSYQAMKTLREFKNNKIKHLNLPTAPQQPIIVREELDRPQPRLDRFAGNGMSITVGRIRRDPVLKGLKFIVLGHNTIRGAAGTAVLTSELIIVKKLL